MILDLEQNHLELEGWLRLRTSSYAIYHFNCRPMMMMKTTKKISGVRIQRKRRKRRRGMTARKELLYITCIFSVFVSHRVPSGEGFKKLEVRKCVKGKKV